MVGWMPKGTLLVASLGLAGEECEGLRMSSGPPSSSTLDFHHVSPKPLQGPG